MIPGLWGGEDITTAASNLMNRLNEIPFEAIGQNLNQTLAGANALVNDRQLAGTIAALRSTLTSTQALVTNLDRGTGRCCNGYRVLQPNSTKL